MQDQEQTVDRMQLARLIKEYRDRTKASYYDLAAKGGIPTTTLQNLATSPLKRMPDKDTLEGVARAIDTRLVAVTRAAGAACGYVISEESLDMPNDEDSHAIVVALPDLKPSQRRSIRELIQHLREANQGH